MGTIPFLEYLYTMFHLLSVFFITLFNPAEIPDSLPILDSANVRQVQINLSTFLNGDTTNLSLHDDRVHRYDPAGLHSHWNANIGNAASHTLPLFFSVDSLIPFHTGFPSLSAYTSPAHPDFTFVRRKPFSQLYYIMGAAKEQMLDITHYQPAGKHFDATLHYRINNAPGSFRNQQAKLGAVSLQSRYQTLDQRYEAALTFRHYKFRHGENGGIANDSMYIANNESDRKVISVNLQNASSVNRLSGWTFLQSYKFAPAESQSPWTVLPSQVVLTAKIDEAYRVFNDPDPLSDYFQNVYIDSTMTDDSVHFSTRSLTLAIKNPSHGKRHLKYQLGLSYQDVRYFDGKNLIPDHYVQSFTDLIFTISRQARVAFHYSQSIGSKWLDGSHTKLALFVNPTPFIDLNLGLGYTDQPSTQFNRSFFGNHIYWENNFSNQTTSQAWAKIRYGKLQLGTQYYKLAGYVYYDKFGFPRQYLDPIQVLNTELSVNLNQRFISTDIKAVYHTNDRESILRYPSFIGSAMIYYHDIWFDSALRIQAGFDLTYLSEWYGYNFSAMTGQNVLQHSRMTGNKLFTDVFINLHLKRASLFIKYRDLGSLLSGEGFFLVPDYPLSRPGLFFGVKWKFFD